MTLQPVLPEAAIADAIALLSQVVRFVVAFAVVYAIGRFLIEPAVDRALGYRRVQRTLRTTVERLVHVAVVFVAVALAFNIAGFGSVFTATAQFAAALTIAIGFATRDVASNLASGAFIVADPTINVGDWIEWKDNSGVIEDISFRVTRVRTFDNELLSVPNAELATNAVTTPVARNTLRIAHVFYVADDSDIDQVRSILRSEARAHEDILDDPEPTVRVTEVNDGRIGVQARIWIGDPSRADFMRVRSEYLTSVAERFAEAGIELPPSW